MGTLTCEGALVGSLVGEEEGIVVGSPLGLRVGVLVGNREGVRVGVIVGLGVGATTTQRWSGIGRVSKKNVLSLHVIVIQIITYRWELL